MNHEALAGHGENYFVPMSDLLAGVVFVLLILIMSLALVTRTDFVASEQAAAEMKRIAAELEKAKAAQRTYLEPREVAAAALDAVLARMSAALTSVGLPNVLDREAGTLAMSSRLFFEEGSRVLTKDGRTRAEQFAAIMKQFLECVADIPNGSRDRCVGIPQARLDRAILAAYVGRAEKRTQGEDTAGALTASQALAIYSQVAAVEPLLLQLLDARGQPGLEFRGFGARHSEPRGIAESALMASDRIELILRMEVPPIPDGVWKLPAQVPAR